MKDRQELEKVFEKVQEQFTFDDAHLELASDETISTLAYFMQESFCQDEPLHKFLNIQCDVEMQERLRSRVRDNLSITLVSNGTNEIIGLVVGHFIHRRDLHKIPQYKNEQFKLVMDFISQKDSEMNVFDKYGVDSAIRISNISVDKRYRNKGIGFKLLQACLLYYSETGITPLVIKVECSNKASDTVFAKSGFELIHEFPYAEYKVGDEFIFQSLKSHVSLTVRMKSM